MCLCPCVPGGCAVYCLSVYPAVFPAVISCEVRIHMSVKTYVTNLPNRSGAFMRASQAVSLRGGNIVRVSYNKAVDLHTLFLDVDAPLQAQEEILRNLTQMGYIADAIPELRVLVVEIQIPDRPGALMPVLEILARYDVNISYMNSSSGQEPFQRFIMGLLIEKPGLLQRLLEEISGLYPLRIQDYDGSGTSLDNTVFYIRLASEMRDLLSLSGEKTMEFLSEANRILQMHQQKGESPDTVFAYIRRFAAFVSRYRGPGFTADVDVLPLGECTLYAIQPPCGSNTYVLHRGDEAVLVDTGYAIYASEMEHIFRTLFPDWQRLRKEIVITHADVDHCGLLALMPGVPVRLTAKSAESLEHQRLGIPDFREASSFCLGYSRLSRLISGYQPPDPAWMRPLDCGVPADHQDLLEVARLTLCGLEFQVFEGSGGHMHGETVYFCREAGLIFTGDNLVNISGFSAERAEFNALAPYLMGSVNIDSGKATRMREQVTGLIAAADCERTAGKEHGPCVVCGGHGPLSVFREGKLRTLDGCERRVLRGC